MRAAMEANEYKNFHARHEPALVALQLKGRPKTRMNSATKKAERSYHIELLQEHMTLDMEQPGHSTPMYLNWPQRLNGPKDMFMMTRQWDLSKMPRAQITEFAPLVTRLKGITFDDSIVHHMDIFLCTDGIKRYPVVTRDIPSMGGHTDCDAMPWAYDRDGKKLTLPDHVGFTIGKGTPYTRLAIEWHYLLARDGIKGLKNVQQQFEDHSGIRLTVTPDLRPHSAGTFGLMDGYMKLPAGKKNLKFSSTTAVGQLDKILHHDLDRFGQVHPVAVHLHMHDHGRKAWWGHYRAGKKVGEYGRIDSYKGFGVDQSFFTVPDRDLHERGNIQQAKKGGFKWGRSGGSIQKGDQMSVNCVFDTTCKYATPIGDPKCERATRSIPYGLSHGQEMCGFLMVYYPHDPDVRYRKGMILGYHRGELIPKDPSMQMDDWE